ncbi:non-canonical purine NTP pyrophosphatase [Edaphobacter modestus]|uniref:dITP/XTP pyrophosphatase n=1 Tax=Edaphobacter modestus TaxID=388466 RepID=A0A4V2G523_9BACT|nr:non-canonical purine NTP pyrophosphatase [Edaphobacter modestus]RZU43226.1 XTP/dITP diphosphohydrolase [Edaphobacter modestus]
MTLYVATSNPGKLRDFSAAAAEVAGTNVRLETLPGLATIPSPPEDEPTFSGNACAKAAYYSLQSPGLIVVADDSGLEVDALDGAPGVRSARYAEDAGFAQDESLPLDERNNRCLLESLKGASEADRRGRYHCVLAAARDGEIIAVADGTVEGTILTAQRGRSGFGYDPLFFLPELGKTMAELEPATKLSFSHRGRALRRLLQTLS